MARYEQQVTGDFNAIVNRLHTDIMNDAVSMNLVDESNYYSGDMKVAVRVYDKYYMRNGNRASLSLTVVGHDKFIFVSAIGAGGGQGVIFNFSLGAEDDMVDIVRSSMNDMMH